MKTFSHLFLSCTFLTGSVFAAEPAAAAQVEKKSKAEVEWRRYDDNSKGFSVKVPSTWQVAPSASLDFIAFLPQTSPDVYPERVALTSEKLKVELGLDDFFKINLEDLKRRDPAFAPISIKDAQVGSIPAKRVVYPAFDKDNEKAITVLQYFFIWNKTAYVLTAIADKDQYVKNEAVFEEVIASFHPLAPK